MLCTNTAIDYRAGTRAAIQPVAVGLPSGADDFSERRNRLEAERAIDDVLADSFPASDPPSWNAGVSRPEPAAPSNRCGSHLHSRCAPTRSIALLGDGYGVPHAMEPEERIDRPVRHRDDTA